MAPPLEVKCFDLVFNESGPEWATLFLTPNFFTVLVYCFCPIMPSILRSCATGVHMRGSIVPSTYASLNFTQINQWSGAIVRLK
eukprot:15324738-Ditylum_brightwellii.AAC.1